MSGQEPITDFLNKAEAPQMQPAKTEPEANSVAQVVPEVQKALDPAEQIKEEEDDDG